MKNYYKILEVSPSASQDDIKKSYRKLALKYHPDKSSYSDAGKLFSLINEAYNVIGKPESRALYDMQVLNQARRQSANTRSNSNTGTYTRARSNPYYRKQRGRPASKLDLAPYIKYFRGVSLGAFIFCMILGADYFLPSYKTPDYVLVKQFNAIKNGYILTINHGLFTVEGAEMQKIKRGQEIALSYTPLFNKLLKLSINIDGKRYDYYLQASIYRNFSFVLFVLAVTSLLGAFHQKHPENVLNFGIVNGVLFILVLVFLAIS